MNKYDTYLECRDSWELKGECKDEEEENEREMVQSIHLDEHH